MHPSLALDGVDSSGVVVSFNMRVPTTAPAHSLRQIVKTVTAVEFNGATYTFEELIKMVAQQMGSAHEDDSVDPLIAALMKSAVAASDTYIRCLDFIGELTIEVGERVIRAAESRENYSRAVRPGFGDITILLGCLPDKLDGNGPLRLPYYFDEARCDVLFTVSSTQWRCDVLENDVQVCQWVGNVDAPLLSLAFQYSSNRRLARVLSPASPTAQPIACNVGWLDVREVRHGAKIRPSRIAAHRALVALEIRPELLAWEGIANCVAATSERMLITGQFPQRVRPFQLNEGEDFFSKLERMLFEEDEVPDFR